MSKHTPGPWHFVRPKKVGDLPQDPEVYNDLRGAGHALVVGAIGYEVEGIEVPSEADARLIAAAPDLLEAIRELRATVIAARNGKPADVPFALRKAGAAIDKARGAS